MPTIRNTRGIDIIASKENHQAVNIQVKTNSYGKIKYPMSKGNEDWIDDASFYVFVTLKNEKDRPDFYIVPSALVVEYIKETHRFFEEAKPRIRLKKGETLEDVKERRRKSTMRQFPNRYGSEVPKFRDLKMSTFQDNWEFERDPLPIHLRS